MVETHWICDVCGNRMIDRNQTKNVNETKIQDWFVITLNVCGVHYNIGEQVHLYGYACSKECYEKVIEEMKNTAYKRMQKTLKGE